MMLPQILKHTVLRHASTFCEGINSWIAPTIDTRVTFRANNYSPLQFPLAMKRILLPHLICPACLPKEYPLRATVDREIDGDIITGILSCAKCNSRFPLRDGIACLLPAPDTGPALGERRYEEEGMTARYLWSHYGDLSGFTDCGDANRQWAQTLTGHVASSFEAGCSVGRMTFEMAARSELAVGCDLSHSFVKTARRLARDRHLTFNLPLEGNLLEDFTVTLPDSWRTDNVEFIIADALRIPFARDTFCRVASINLLDRVNHPLAHLFEMNRVARTQNASFFLADPFSWSTGPAPEERWLGGTMTGPYRGRAFCEGGMSRPAV